MNIKWTIIPTKKVEDKAIKLSERVLLKLRLLFADLASDGPAAFGWPNYSKLQGRNDDERHCHLQKGKPTYVCCWRVLACKG